MKINNETIIQIDRNETFERCYHIINNDYHQNPRLLERFLCKTTSEAVKSLDKLLRNWEAENKQKI